jgi:Tfp pilus assembly protein PilZ
MDLFIGQGVLLETSSLAMGFHPEINSVAGVLIWSTPLAGRNELIGHGFHIEINSVATALVVRDPVHRK